MSLEAASIRVPRRAERTALACVFLGPAPWAPRLFYTQRPSFENGPET